MIKIPDVAIMVSVAVLMAVDRAEVVQSIGVDSAKTPYRHDYPKHREALAILIPCTHQVKRNPSYDRGPRL